MSGDLPIPGSGLCLSCGACVAACCSEARDAIGRSMTVGEAMAEIAKDMPFYEESGGGVTFSGGEPLAQPDFLEALLKACRHSDIHTAVDTCGAAPYEVFERILPYVNLFLYDLKVMDEARHIRDIGVSNRLILENLRRLDRDGANLAIRTPVVPGLTDDDENIEKMGAFVAGLKNVHYIVLLPYHETGLEKYRLLGREHGMPPTRTPAPERLEEIAAGLRRYGMAVSIGG